jgi:hypothetical protein
MSIAVTMLCAGVPAPPLAPNLVFGNRDIIEITWQPPSLNYGSPVLGFFVYMKKSSDAQYTLIQNFGEDPT